MMAAKTGGIPKAHPVENRRKAVRPLPESYFVLIREFPLIPIRNDAHLAEASHTLNTLLRRRLDRGEQAYLDVLTHLIEAYEDEHVIFPEASEADVLRGLMDANRLTQAELGERVGIARSTISAILNGKRSLTKGQVVKMAKAFGLSPSTFLGAAPADEAARRETGTD